MNIKKKEKKNVHHQVRSEVRRRVKRKRNHYSVKDRCKWLQKDDSKEKYHTRIYIYNRATSASGGAAALRRH